MFVHNDTVTWQDLFLSDCPAFAMLPPEIWNNPFKYEKRNSKLSDFLKYKFALLKYVYTYNNTFQQDKFKYLFLHDFLHYSFIYIYSK